MKPIDDSQSCLLCYKEKAYPITMYHNCSPVYHALSPSLYLSLSLTLCPSLPITFSLDVCIHIQFPVSCHSNIQSRLFGKHDDLPRINYRGALPAILPLFMLADDGLSNPVCHFPTGVTCISATPLMRLKIVTKNRPLRWPFGLM